VWKAVYGPDDLLDELAEAAYWACSSDLAGLQRVATSVWKAAGMPR